MDNWKHDPWLGGHFYTILGINKFPNWFIVKKLIKDVMSSNVMQLLNNVVILDIICSTIYKWMNFKNLDG